MMTRPQDVTRACLDTPIERWDGLLRAHLATRKGPFSTDVMSFWTDFPPPELADRFERVLAYPRNQGADAARAWRRVLTDAGVDLRDPSTHEGLTALWPEYVAVYRAYLCGLSPGMRQQWVSHLPPQLWPGGTGGDTFVSMLDPVNTERRIQQTQATIRRLESERDAAIDAFRQDTCGGFVGEWNRLLGGRKQDRPQRVAQMAAILRSMLDQCPDSLVGLTAPPGDFIQWANENDPGWAIVWREVGARLRQRVGQETAAAGDELVDQLVAESQQELQAAPPETGPPTWVYLLGIGGALALVIYLATKK